MQVPDSLSRRPKSASEIEDLLRLKPAEQDNTKFEIPLVTKDGKVTKILLKLNKDQMSDPPVLDITTFDYTNDPDYGELFSNLDPKKPSSTLYYKHK
eukprot:840197-Rhodomonas_salina.1